MIYNKKIQCSSFQTMKVVTKVEGVCVCVWFTPWYCSKMAHCLCFDWWQKSANQASCLQSRFQSALKCEGGRVFKGAKRLKCKMKINILACIYCRPLDLLFLSNLISDKTSHILIHLMWQRSRKKKRREKRQASSCSVHSHFELFFSRWTGLTKASKHQSCELIGSTERLIII